MKKRIKIVAVLSCVLLLGFGSITVFAENNMFETDGGGYLGLLFRAGQIRREYLDLREATLLRNDRSDVFIESADFVIHESEISRRHEQYKLVGIEDGRERAIRSLLRRGVLYNEAISRGFYAGYEEVRDYINIQIEAARSAENFADYQAYLDGLGMNDEEYWESQFDTFREEITIHKFIVSERDSIRAGSGLVDTQIIEDRLQSYLQGLIDNYVVVNGLEWALEER